MLTTHEIKNKNMWENVFNETNPLASHLILQRIEDCVTILVMCNSNQDKYKITIFKYNEEYKNKSLYV